jgi:NO-binding membrane sensor protein with MHYT domain/nitrogen-specific signal transduction histidine kinase
MAQSSQDRRAIATGVSGARFRAADRGIQERFTCVRDNLAMLKVVYLCVTDQHDLRLVALAGFMCLFACFTACNIYARAGEARGGRRLLWIVAASFVFGCGVWTTHFVAELAYQPGIPVGYDPGVTALSAVLAVGVTLLGVIIALEFNPGIGGAIVGLSVGALHYTGVMAMLAPASFHWNPEYVLVSLAIAVVLSTAAFETMARGPELRRRVAASVLLLLGIVGLHFTGMAALTLAFDPTVAVPSAALAPGLLATAVAGVSAVIITAGLASAIADGQLAQRAKAESAKLAARIEERTNELHDAQTELLRQERLATMGQLTATVAHELRNPLSAVRNSLFAVRETLKAHGIDLDRPLNRAERSISRCDRIISDLLEYTRKAELRRATVVADEWIAAAVASYQLPPGIRLERDCGAPGCEVFWDADAIRRVLANVIENAAQALGDNDGERRITVSTRAIDRQLVLAVADTGPGIAADVLPKVFEPLYSTKSFGTGLGLPAVKQIVEQHGGTVQIESAPGAGTKVAIRLPLSPAGAMAA